MIDLSLNEWYFLTWVCGIIVLIIASKIQDRNDKRK